MKNLILIIGIVFFVVLNTNAQNVLKRENGIKSAIKLCKEISKKDVITSLESPQSPKELLDAQYASVEQEVEKKVGEIFSDILEDYKSFAKKNSERNRKKVFKIPLKKGKVKNEISDQLSNYREWMRENKNSYYVAKIDSEFVKEITKQILTDYYVPTLSKGVEKHTNDWFKIEAEDYHRFLQSNTIDPKIDNEKMIEDMASDYLDDNKEEIIKLLLYLSQMYNVKKEYGHVEINIEAKNKNGYKYISTLRSLFSKALNSGETEIASTTDLYKMITKNIKEDIKKQIKISTRFK